MIADCALAVACSLAVKMALYHSDVLQCRCNFGPADIAWPLPLSNSPSFIWHRDVKCFWRCCK
eukprot:14184-Eustigmatos_ZCMA.PRE.1